MPDVKARSDSRKAKPETKSKPGTKSKAKRVDDPRLPFTREDLQRRFEALGVSDILTYEDPETVSRTIRRMIAAGRQDAALGRLFEGHVNALQLIRLYGNDTLSGWAEAAESRGHRAGVWNNDHRGNPVREDGVLPSGRLRGAKSFASGAGLLTHALVTSRADSPDEVRMWLVELDDSTSETDRSWWQPTGMQRSETHIVSWDGRKAPRATAIGGPGLYQLQPHFSGGGLRFAAVQAGAVAGLHDRLVTALTERERAGHPIQRRRIAESFSCAQTAIDAVMAVARAYEMDDLDLLPRVDAARHRVLECAEEQIMRVQRSVGLGGMMHPHPLATHLSDLAVYIRQPNPDGSLDAVAEAVLDGGLDFNTAGC
jgi:alkylation response protein AidB-like acyl-CoA dehydrogenase